jgi:pimeloyl-ACP methyl ester carboxylesterase
MVSFRLQRKEEALQAPPARGFQPYPNFAPCATRPAASACVLGEWMLLWYGETVSQQETHASDVSMQRREIMPHITVGDDRWHYIHHRSGSDASLVLVHGSGGSHRHWPSEIADLHGVDVIVPDLPGHGDSTGNSRNRVPEYARALEAFCRQMALSRVTLAGHSLGGAIALQLSLSAPPWLERVVLVGTGCRLRVLPAILDGIRTDTEQTAGLIAEMAFGSGVDRDRIGAFAAELAALDPVVTHGDFSACDTFDVCDRLEEIRIPALIVSAEEDRLTPVRYGRFLEQHMPYAQMVVVPGAGHMMALERPKRFVASLRRFLEEGS